MSGIGGTWQDWTHLPPFTIKDGREVYPVYAEGAFSDRFNGGTIHVNDSLVALEDVESMPGMKRRIGTLVWGSNRRIAYLEVNDAWRGQGVARAMLALARSEGIEPRLKHAPCTQRSLHGELFVRGTDPEEECRGVCEPDCRNWASQIGKPGGEGSPASVRPLSVWAKITRLFRR